MTMASKVTSVAAMWTVITVVALVVAALAWWGSMALDPRRKMTSQQAAVYTQAQRDSKKREAERQRAQIVCPRCQVAGHVTVSATSKKRGVSGGKATGALLTGGASLLLVGLSRKEYVQLLTCSNCGMTTEV